AVVVRVQRRTVHRAIAVVIQPIAGRGRPWVDVRVVVVAVGVVLHPTVARLAGGRPTRRRVAIAILVLVREPRLRRAHHGVVVGAVPCVADPILVQVAVAGGEEEQYHGSTVHDPARSDKRAGWRMESASSSCSSRRSQGEGATTATTTRTATAT